MMGEVTVGAVVRRCIGMVTERNMEPSNSSGIGPSEPSDRSREAAAIDAGRLAELRTLDPPDGPTMLSVLAGIFLGDTPHKLTSLRRAVLESNTDTVEGVAHYLKGAAANIGATRMAALCAELENLARSGGLTPSPHLLTRLDAEFAHAREELEAQLAQG
jgi:two-component system sensor histidine kinase/response regulator